MPRKFDVVVHNVREVSLVGDADLNYWRTFLQRHDLHPTVSDGRAEMLLSSCDARFFGMRFREFLVSVFVTEHAGGSSRDGVFLVRAFNSRRFFAWVERTRFSTPYYPGEVALSPQSPAFIQLGSGSQPIVRVSMGAANNAALNAATPTPDGWQGPIFLPNLNDPNAASTKLFYASLTGGTQTIAFDDRTDSSELGLADSNPAVAVLRDSGFVPNEWILRAAATHGKSKTISRTPGQDFAEFASGRPREAVLSAV